MNSNSNSIEAPRGTGNDWELRFILNGEPIELQIDPHLTLLEMLREQCGLTGTKGACTEGECGSCIILLDGKPHNSCLVMAPQVEGRQVTTIEGLGAQMPEPLQDAFVENGAVQCGFCTPGMLLSARALLSIGRHPSVQDIREALAGNICRCTGYTKVVQAVQEAAQGLNDGAAPS